MRLLVTGGTGFVGSAVVRDLLGAGHQVLGLARSSQSATKLRSLGADATLGSLEQPDRLAAAAGAVDGVIHLAFDNSDLARFAANGQVERTALDAVGDVLQHTGRPLVVTTGFASVAPGRVAAETDAASAGGPIGRGVEEAARALADRDVNVSVVRMPCVHGDGDRFTIPQIIAWAVSAGSVPYVGNGRNRWAAVAGIDAARVFRLAAERAKPGAVYHAVAEEGIPFIDIATVIGARLGLPVTSVPPDEAAQRLGAFASFLAADLPASSALTREWLGWTPIGPGLLADINRPEYYPDSPEDPS